MPDVSSRPRRRVRKDKDGKKKVEDEYFTNSFGIRMKKQKGNNEKKSEKKKEKENLHKGKVDVL